MLSSSQLKAAFNEFDKDSSGYLSLDEIVKLSTKLGTKVAKRELEALFHSIDTDKNGMLSFDEFLAWYRVGKNTKLAHTLKYQLSIMQGLNFLTFSDPKAEKR